MRVLKFGGTSLADGPRIDLAARLISDVVQHRPVVVVSAIAGVTNRLVELSQSAVARGADGASGVEAIGLRHLEILDRLPPKFRRSAAEAIRSVINDLGSDLRTLADDSLNRSEIVDRVLAVGERLSNELVAATLCSIGCAARPVDATDLILTDECFGEAEVDPESTRRRCQQVLGTGDAPVPVITGFIGADRSGRTTTLGRGGSDSSAAVLGAALDAERVEIWTDVDGVLTAPPHLVPSVSTIPWLSYEEAAELSFFGAKVLHPKTVQPLADRGVPIHVRNSLAPTRRGTEINRRVETASRVVAVSVFEDVDVCRVASGMPVPTQGVLMSSRASADGQTLVATAVRCSDESSGLSEQQSRGAIVTLVGHDIALQPWVAGRSLEALARRGIVVRSFASGAGPHTIALLVDGVDLQRAVCIIHDALMLDREQAPPRNTDRKQNRQEVRHVSAA